MEPDVSIETSSMIRVAVLPIGHVPPVLLRDYHAMLLRHQTIPLSAVSSFYTEHQKSPFAHQPWDSGSLRFKFVLGGAPPSPWEDFQSNRKTLAVIGICHCPSSPDLGSVMDQFDTACRAYPAALVERCFAFSPADSQLEDGSKKGWNLMLFPPADRATQEFHLQTMMQDIAASLLMEFEKWVLKAEPAGTIVKTPLDSQATLNSEEVIKAKKRRLGRAQKTMGDYCMLAGSPVDANLHYSTALELARLTGDFFWYAGALEGSVCALLIDQMGQKDTAVEEEVRYRYSSVILHYKKSFIQENAQRVSPLTFELEATLKLARFLCRRELAKEVVELLTNAADGAKSLIDASDRLVLYVEIARLYGTLGYQRKAAFFSRQVAQLYLQQDNRLAAISAMQVLAMTTKAYRVQSKASVLEDSLSKKETGSGLAESGKILHQSVVSLFESQWSTLQMVVLREILLSAVRAGDPLAAWGAAARLLRSYYPLITPAGQNGLASALSNSADRLPSGTRCADPALPFIRLYSFPLHPSQMDIVKRNPAREDWWAGAANTGPFIYTPFSKGEPSNSSKQELIWIVGEPVQILVELANPCGFDLKVDSIYLSVPSGNFDAFPVAVNLPPNSSKVVTLSGIPTSVGPVTIPGCTVHCFGVITEHLFKDVDNLLLGATQGLVLSDPFRCCGSARLKNISVPSISVVPPLPLLVSRVVGGDGAIILHEGEIRDIWISLANAGTVPVEQVHVSLSGKHQDSVLSIASETLKSALPLRPGAEVTIPVTLKAWRIVAADADTAAGRSASKHSKDGNSPTLLIHYAGTVPNTEDPSTDKSVVPPGRRLVVPLQICVLQGLSFVKARLLSMEIPAQVGYNLPTPVHTDYSLTEGAAGTPNKLDQLVKIDPFRGSWGLRFLELELSNPTDVVFEISVSVQLENTDHEQSLSVDQDATEYGYPKTRIDRDCSARVLIPLEHFKLPVLDDSFFVKDNQADGSASGRSTSFSERNTKAELNASIKNLISRIKVRWQSGRNSSGELNIKDAVQAALQTSVMDVLLPDPLTFGFRLSRSGPGPENIDSHEKSNDEVNSSASKGSVMAHEMTPMEVMVRNNTKELIKMSLNVVCRDVAGEDCVECAKATVLCSGVLSGITVEIPPLEEIKHSFSLYFLVPGEYTLIAAAMIEDATDILRARARTTSSDEPIFCHGPPYHGGIEFEFQPDAKSAFLRLLPLRSISRCWGVLTSVEIPVSLRSRVYGAWARAFHSNLEEAALPLEEYATLQDFFVRTLKEGSRPIDPDPQCLVSPVDGTVLRFGEIKGAGAMIEQVKGFSYSVFSLLGATSFLPTIAKGDMQDESSEPENVSGEKSRKSWWSISFASPKVWNPYSSRPMKGLFYCVIYLKPGDYHRVHAPADWNILARRHFSGRLYPVNERATRTIRNLYVENERVVLEGLWQEGFMALAAVGATNIGSIELSIEPELRTNQAKKKFLHSERPEERLYEPDGVGRTLKKGDEVAAFNMGSTVVLVFQAPLSRSPENGESSSDFKFLVQRGDRVRAGEALGRCQDE